MQKDKVILIVIATFVVGFLFGAISGIKFYASEIKGQVAGRTTPPQGVPTTGSMPPGEDAVRLETLLKTEPDNLQTLTALGNIYFDANQFQKAIDMYERALAIDPKNPDVRTDMAIMYRSLRNYDRAVKEFREAAARDPKHVNSRFNLGIVLFHDKKDIKGAIAAWEDYLKLEPTGERADMVRKQIEQARTMIK